MLKNKLRRINSGKYFACFGIGSEKFDEKEVEIHI